MWCNASMCHTYMHTYTRYTSTFALVEVRLHLQIDLWFPWNPRCLSWTGLRFNGKPQHLSYAFQRPNIWRAWGKHTADCSPEGNVSSSGGISIRTKCTHFDISLDLDGPRLLLVLFRLFPRDSEAGHLAADRCVLPLWPRMICSLSTCSRTIIFKWTHYENCAENADLWWGDAGNHHYGWVFFTHMKNLPWVHLKCWSGRFDTWDVRYFLWSQAYGDTVTRQLYMRSGVHLHLALDYMDNPRKSTWTV